MELQGSCHPPASFGGSRKLVQAAYPAKERRVHSTRLLRVSKPQQRHAIVVSKALPAPTLSALTLAGNAPFWLAALLAFWPLSKAADALQNWYRGFRICCELPGTPYSKSILQSLGGDLRHGLSPQIHREFTALAEQYGGVYHSRVLWAQVVVISDPYVVSQVLSNSSFDKLANCGYESSDLMMSDHGGLTPNLVSSQTDAYWQAVRKAVTPAFASSHLKERFADVSEIGSDLVRVLHSQTPSQPVDIYKALLCLSVDVIGKFGFNHDLKAVQTFGNGGATPAFLQSILDATVEAEQYLVQPWRRFIGFVPSVRRGKQKFEVFKNFIRQLLCEVKARGEPAPADQTIAANLRRCRDPATNAPLSDAQLLPMAAMFFWAGYDTSGVTMTWTIFLISQHPEVEVKLVEELNQQGLLATPDQPHPRPLRYEDTNRLPYLSMVVREAQRLFPAVSGGSARRCDTHDNWLTSPTLGKFCIPKNVSVWMVTHALHNTSHNWSNPEKFDPSRWKERLAEYAPAAARTSSNAPRQSAGCPRASEGLQISEVPSRARRYMPFMDGQRDCIGQSLANVTAISALARLYGSFSFQLSEDMGGASGVRADEHLNLGIISPAHGLRVVALPRAAPVA
ncbi:hypothetical protein WJX74_007245 [Apatococcus lobatus]|uniref:Cytochrome P450 n=1 Tax=Apatococcus lobatus TaxID=904363 RepID=A0AAW1RWY3_9CHLO